MNQRIAGSSAGGVAYAAHSSGYVFGIGICLLLLAAKVLPRDAFDMLNLMRASHRRRRYRRMVSKGYDPIAGRRSEQPTSRKGETRKVETATAGTPTSDSSNTTSTTSTRPTST